jgi:restriction system protein
LAWNDPLGTRPPRIKVQVKREQSAVNVAVLRSFMALLGENDVGIFVNSGGFTRDSEEEARTQQSRQVTLINLERLYDLWIEHLERIDEEGRILLPLKPIFFLAPKA